MFEQQLKKDFLTAPSTPDELFNKTIKIFTDKIDMAIPYHMGDRYEMTQTICEKFEMMPLFVDQFQIDIKENLIWIDYTEESSTVPELHRAPKRGFLVETTKSSTFAYFACYFESMRRWLPGSFAYIIFGLLPEDIQEAFYMLAVNHLYDEGITYIPTSMEQFKSMKVSFFPYPQYTHIFKMFKNDEGQAIALIREDQPDIAMLNISLIKIYDLQRYEFMRR